MLTAIWMTCAGVLNEGIRGHSMRDNCGSCMPYWEQYPACPDCKVMLGRNKAAKSGDKRKCPTCNKFVKIEACKVSPENSSNRQ